MKVEVKEPKSWLRIIEFELPSQQVRETIEELYLEYGRNARIPGFRPGRIPRAMLEARFAKDIESEAIERLVPESYRQALVDHKLIPVNRAQISDLDLSADKVLRFKATFEVMPKVEIKRYRGIPAVKKLKAVTQDDVERELDFLRQLYAEFTEVDRPSSDGDRVVIDYQPLAEFSGSEKFKAQDYAVDLSAPQVLPEFRQGLLGVRAGEERQITVQYPQDHPAPEAAGKKIGFQVSVKKVMQKSLPSLDDGFAQKVSGYPTLAELKEKIQAGLEAEAERQAMEQVRLQVLNTIMAENPLELPQSLVAEEVERLMANARERHRMEHRHPDGQSCADCHLDEEKLAQEFRPVAEWRLRQDIILSHIAQQEKIEASEEEVEDFIARMARDQRTDPQKLRSALDAVPERMEELRDRLAVAKTAEMLGQWAEITMEK